MNIAERLVGIVAADPLVRGGLLAVFSHIPGWTPTGQFDPQSLLAQLEFDPQALPDALLWDVGWPAPQSLDALQQVLADYPAIALFALVDAETDATPLWNAGVHGLLPRTAPPEQIVAALDAVAAGLRVIAPHLLPVLRVDSDSQPPLLEALTPRELEVLQLVAQGLPNKAIARELAISEHTVKFHMNSILGKLNAQSRTEAVVTAGRAGIIQV